ncbi:MAG: hypothetical protein FVQ81_02535 [Candidatus Glassbacteria bacterium]|nr:hypothetical protein [Candidatus Glassbacteria bacterium]
MRTAAWFVSLFLLAAVLVSCGPGSRQYPIRWVYISRGLSNDQHVEDIREIARTASEHGMNGIYLSSGFDGIDLKGKEYFRRLGEVKQIADEYGLDIIPRCMDIGYNGSMLAHNRNLAAGIPVRDALFVVKGKRVIHMADPAVSLGNGGFEKAGRSEVPGWELPGALGEVTFIDREEVREGRIALRFENFGGKEDNPGRLVRKVEVTPDRLYRLKLWVKTSGMDESGAFGSGNFQVHVLGGEDRRELTYLRPRVGQDTDWTEVVVGFNSRGYEMVEIVIGMYGADQGTFWLDGISLEEIGMVNLLRRAGTPLTVKGEKSGTVYEEGRDFLEVADNNLDFNWDHDSPPIVLTDDSRISDGERLRVSFYHGVKVYASQVTACMSEPEIFDVWRRTIPLIEKHLDPKYYFISVDEVRAGGTCAACTSRNMTIGQILADCITRQVQLVHEIAPDAECITWSDMFDPNHNAGDRRGRGYYYHVDGTFDNSWVDIPRELIMACWNHRMRHESLSHFSNLGFRTFGCGYYDKDDISNDTTWVEALDETPGALGLLYTSWLNKFELLDEFGDMLSAHVVPEEIVRSWKRYPVTD